MLKTILKKYRTLLLYGILGSIGALVDFLAYLLFVKVFGISPSIATFLSVSCGIVTSFILNSRFNFKKTDHKFARFILFYLVGLAGAILSAILIFVFFNLLGLDAILAKIITIPPVVLFQYFINKHVSFSDEPHSILIKAIAYIKKHSLTIFLMLVSACAFFSNIFYLPAFDDMDNLLSGKLIIEGLVPYRDFFSHHSAGMYYLSALIYPFTQNSVFTYRLIFNVILFALLLLLSVMIKKRVNARSASAFLLLASFGHSIAFAHLPLGESIISLLFPITILIIWLKPIKQILSLKSILLLSILLFLIPFFSFSYLIPTLIIYMTIVLEQFLASAKSLQDKVIHFLKISSIFALPYLLYFLFLFASGSLKDFIYDLLKFNANYYAPMVGEVGGNIIRTLVAIVLRNLSQLSTLGLNLTNPLYFTQILLVIGYGYFVYASWLSGKKLLAVSVSALFIFLNPRTNLFNHPAIASSPAELAQHASVYFFTAIFLGICAFGIMKSKDKVNKIHKSVAFLFYAILSLTIIGIWSNRMNEVFIEKKSLNYYSYSASLANNSIATVINKLLTPKDSAWIGPDQFSSYLFLEPKRATHFTFYLPWIDQSQKLRSDFIHQLNNDKPKIIYFGKYNAVTYTYSDDVHNLLKDNYFTVSDNRLDGYYFLSNQKDSLIKELTNNGYKI